MPFVQVQKTNQFDEKAFQAWYKNYAEKLDLNLNPDDPKHFYDYRAAYLANAEPDEKGKWPSEFKKEGHPQRFVLIEEGKDTLRSVNEMLEGDSSERKKEEKQKIGRAIAHSQIFDVDPSLTYENDEQIQNEIKQRKKGSFEQVFPIDSKTGDYEFGFKDAVNSVIEKSVPTYKKMLYGLSWFMGESMKADSFAFLEEFAMPEEEIKKGLNYKIGNALSTWGKRGSEEIDKELQALIEQVPEELQGRLWDHPEYLLDTNWLTMNIGDAAISFIPTVAAYIVGGPVAAGVTGGSMEMVGLYDQLIKEGIDEEKARQAATAFGVVTGILNTIGVGKVLGKKEVTGFASRVAKWLISGLWEAGTEYAEEPFQAAFKAIAEEKSVPEIVRDVGESFKNIDVMVGAGIMGAGTSIFAPTTTVKKEAKEVAPKPTPVERETERFTVPPEKITEEELTEIGEELKEFKKATSGQIKQAHTIARKKGWISKKGKTNPSYKRLAESITGVKSMKNMSEVEAAEFIQALRVVPSPKYMGGKMKPVIVPLTKEITPEGFFEKEFKEPSLAKFLTPSNRYAYSLGVYDFIEPSIKAKTAMIVERQEIFNELDRTRKTINKIGNVSIIERKTSRLRNVPTSAEQRMWENLNKYKTAQEAGLEGKEATVFTELRTLTDTMLQRTNEVRTFVGLGPIKGMDAYVTHISDMFTKRELAEKYPFPEEVKYWLDWINPQHIYNPTALQRLFEKRPGLLKDPIRALKAMTSMDLKQIYLEQPAILFKEQMEAFKGIMPASTRQWLQAYMNEVVKGMPTKLDNLTNATLDNLGITKMIDFVLKPFGRTLSYNPSKDIANIVGRLVHDATIWGRIKLVIRNHTQKFLSLGLYDTKAFTKAMLPASEKLKGVIKQNDFWKISRRQFMEQLPEGVFGKLERLGFKPYGHSHISNVTFSMKAAYYAAMELVENPKYKELGWTKEEVLKEMEHGATTTQYWYNVMGMSEIYRSGLTRTLGTLQSWWQNYVFNYWREILSRAIYGKTGWGKPIPVKWRIGAVRHIVTSILLTEILRRAFDLDYRRIALLGTLPAYMSPPGHFIISLYNYIVAQTDRQRNKAVNAMKSAWKAFVPGSGAWRDYSRAWKGEITAKELFFYTKKEKEEASFAGEKSKKSSWKKKKPRYE